MQRSQLDHWDNVSDQYSAIENFMEFLISKGINLDFEYADIGTPMEFRLLLDEFLKIDRKQLENERRTVLESLRNSNGG